MIGRSGGRSQRWGLLATSRHVVSCVDKIGNILILLAVPTRRDRRGASRRGDLGSRRCWGRLRHGRPARKLVLEPARLHVMPRISLADLSRRYLFESATISVWWSCSPCSSKRWSVAAPACNASSRAARPSLLDFGAAVVDAMSARRRRGSRVDSVSRSQSTLLRAEAPRHNRCAKSRLWSSGGFEQAVQPNAVCPTSAYWRFLRGKNRWG